MGTGLSASQAVQFVTQRLPWSRQATPQQSEGTSESDHTSRVLAVFAGYVHHRTNERTPEYKRGSVNTPGPPHCDFSCAAVLMHIP